MHIVRATPEETADSIAAELNALLSAGSVLWLVSGGSNINLAVTIRKKLTIFNQLTVGLIDERYGVEGHPDSNWHQLMEAGSDVSDLTVMPVLHNESIEDTARNYAVMLDGAVKNHDCTIGIFGIGADGRTSGVLPGSEAVSASDTVTWYIAEDYERITTTPHFFKHIGKAYLVAFGENKRHQLERLHSDLSVSEQPAQALKVISNLEVYTDQAVGGDNA